MMSMLQDLRLAFRWLMRRRGLAFVSVASLALGIGANVAVFSVIDAFLFRPFPVEAPEDIVVLRSRTGEGEVRDLSGPDYADFRGAVDVLGDLAAHMAFTFSVRAKEETERLQGELVSASYFDVLGVAPRTGRAFSPDEERSPHPVVVISHRLWRARFGEDEEILGKTLRVNGRDLTIVGVAPPGFRGTTIPAEMDLWAPLAMIEALWPRAMAYFEKRDQASLRVIARLDGDVGLAEANAAVEAQARALELAYPDTNGGTTALVVPFDDARLVDRGAVTSYLTLLFGVVFFVLLIACANVSGLRILDLASREGELATRSALGAGRLRLARLILTESTIVYALALAVSVAVAKGLLLLFGRIEVLSMSLGELRPEVDWRVLGSAFALALAAGLLASLVPVVQLRGTFLPGRSAGLASRARTARLRSGLLVVQVALSCALLVGAGLLARTVHGVYGIDPGYRLDEVLFVSVELQSMEFRYDESRARDFYREAIDRVSSLPGVRSAAWSADIPFGRMTILSMFVPEEEARGEPPDWLQSDADIVTPGFLRTMGLPLLAGRDFTDDDDLEAPGVILINETMARSHWPGVDPIGRRVRVFGRPGIPHDTYEIIGVVRDAKYRNLWEEPRPYFYFPLGQRFFQHMNLHVYTEGPPMAMLPAVRGVIHAMDDDLPLFNARPLSEERAVLLSGQRSAGLLFGVSGVLALLLSAVGTYGVTASSLATRRPEVGLRVALGAQSGDVQRFILEKGLGPLALGLTLGLLASFALSRFVEHLLIGVGARDAVAFAGALGVMALSGFAASYVPARRARRIDPATALRGD